MNRRIPMHIRLSADEYARLRAAATSASTTISSLLRVPFTSLGQGIETAPLASVPAGGPLIRMVSLRLTTAEVERLTEQARDCGLPVAAYVRCVLRGCMPSPRRPEARSAVVALSRVGNNLNQISRT